MEVWDGANLRHVHDDVVLFFVSLQGVGHSWGIEGYPGQIRIDQRSGSTPWFSTSKLHFLPHSSNFNTNGRPLAFITFFWLGLG